MSSKSVFIPEVLLLARKLKRRQIAGSYQVSWETANALRIVIGKTRWNDVNGLIQNIKENGKLLIEAQQVETATGNIVRRVLSLIREENHTLVEANEDLSAKEFKDSLKNVVMDSVKELMDEIEDASSNIARQALEHIHTNEIIMTVGKSGAVEKFLKEAAKVRKFQVIVAETAPLYQGQETALALSKAGIDTTVVSDAAIFAMMSRVNKVILGTHAVLGNGALVAVNGSHVMAAAAKHHSTPVVVLSELFKFSVLYPFDPERFNVFLSPNDVFSFEDGDIIDRIDVINPQFDFVVPELVNLYITNFGAYPASYIGRLLSETYNSADIEL
ncbi:Translation initiation factor eIF-2B subunit beta [Phlyctochytrium planicorne]|nr:Translation initiation factor eIF-2B subunit beta [Phlyctochytrium planicorne]